MTVQAVNTREQRKPYRKPEIRRVLLRPEEAVLGTCKSTGAGPYHNDCVTLPVCSVSGS